MAEIGTIASRPWTPVVAATSGIVPFYDVSIMPTLPVAHVGSGASVLPSGVVYAFARPFSQSMIAVAPSFSLRPPDVGQPVDQPVPGDSECMTPKPRGTHVSSKSLLMFGLVFEPLK